MGVVTNDTCTGSGQTEMRLMLTSCNKEQFTCDDGLCISMDKRCDTKQDCEDLSDEKGCILVHFDKEKYLKDIPPPPIDDSKTLLYDNDKSIRQKEFNDSDWTNKLKIYLK